MHTIDLEDDGYVELNLGGRKSRTLDLWKTNNAIARLHAETRDKPREESDAAFRAFVEAFWDGAPPVMTDRLVHVVIERIAQATADSAKKAAPAPTPTASPA